MWRARRRQGGFTLIEVTITVAILALATAVVVPALSNVTLAELKSAAGQLAGSVRHAYDAAALSGEPHRLVFTPGDSKVKLERGQTPTSGGGGLLGLAALAMGGLGEAEDEEDAPLDVPPPTEIVALFGGTLPDGSEPPPLATGLATFSADGNGLDFGQQIKVMDVWIEGMAQPATEGITYLHFYPHGYTQKALIHLVDEDGRIFTVEVKALTGKTAVHAGYVEVPK